MARSTQATASSKGYLLQDYFGIYFFFEEDNYKKISYIKLESNKEDIEIKYYDNTYDYIQVKTKEKPAEDKSFDKEKFQKGAKTLYTALEKANKENEIVNRLILANNMFNQGIKRLNQKIDNGLEENFNYGINRFTEEEKEEFILKIGYPIDDKFYIARIDESYYYNKSKILPELKDFFNEMDLKDVEGIIYNELKTLFRENSSFRDKYIEKKDIAWIFIKSKCTQSNIISTFNKLFEDELSKTDYDYVEDLLDDIKIIDIIDMKSNYYDIYLHFEKIKINYSLNNGTIRRNNLKEFIKIGGIEFLKEDYLYLDDRNKLDEQEKELIYFYLFLFIHRKKSETESIYDKFEINNKEGSL
ncbi:MAG: dsDNA nuclease domain-containing protein [Cetobacterium sp.]|uniref:dsDNA nuclease domain-containing protein n=1 Tax=Cetobacterium sp. TaxID=2071632 RepID=UPI003EE51FEC